MKLSVSSRLVLFIATTKWHATAINHNKRMGAKMRCLEPNDGSVNWKPAIILSLEFFALFSSLGFLFSTENQYLIWCSMIKLLRLLKTVMWFTIRFVVYQFCCCCCFSFFLFVVWESSPSERACVPAWVTIEGILNAGFWFWNWTHDRSGRKSMFVFRFDFSNLKREARKSYGKNQINDGK